MIFGCKWGFISMRSGGQYKPAILDGKQYFDDNFSDEKTIFSFNLSGIFTIFDLKKRGWVWALRCLK